MSTILIPTDFSNNAHNAFEYGLSLLGNNHRYILFNAYEEPKASVTSMVSLRDILLEASEDSLEEDKADLESRFPGLKLEVVAEYGDPVFAITNYALNNKVDLIVMGTAGISGFQKLFLGSVAAAVVEKAPCPVLVVPVGHTFEAPKNILFTADLNNPDDVDLPKVFIDMSLDHGSEITVLKVNRLNEEIDVDKAEKGYALHMAMHNIPHTFAVVNSEDTEFAIREYAAKNKADMLVTTPRKSSWLQRILKTSVSRELAEHLNIPMLAIH